MRYFIALEIPEENQSEIRQMQQGLKEIIPQVKLTENHKLHLTIAFIGDQSGELKSQFIEIINNAIKGVGPFSVTPAYLDAFPNLHHPNVFWTGIKGDIDKLFILRERIRDGLSALGLPADERRFIPHIAIAKISNFKLNKTQESKIQQMMLKNYSKILVESIKLFESIPNHGFHKHNTLAEIKLAA